jgi:hypothetical protein
MTDDMIQRLRDRLDIVDFDLYLDAADALAAANPRIAELETKCRLYEASLDKADIDTARLDFLLNNTGRYRLYQNKKFWWCVPIAGQDWEDGYKSPREAIDAALAKQQDPQ